MISQFRRYVSENQLFRPDEKILLAVSGGVDSMVMWDLFEKSGFHYAVIHCNFQLRGYDSDADEILVVQKAEKLGVKILTRRFETAEHAKLTGVSIEMAARELRYAWFVAELEKSGFHYIATAHHQDDLLETFFINLIRKTGIRGLTGIKAKSDKIIRPMLFTNRRQIETFAGTGGIEYRVDDTNSEVIFQRNFIRHNIIPAFEQLNPAFRNNLAGTINNLRQVEEYYLWNVGQQIEDITERAGEQEQMSVPLLLKTDFSRQILFEWLSRFSFNPATIDSIHSHLKSSPGRLFYSGTHRLVIDREKLIITSLPDGKEPVFYIGKSETGIREPLHLKMEYFSVDEVEIVPDKNMAFVDVGKLVFPLIIRKWKGGEYFQPLGMEGFKKLSDFFIDQKLSIPEKESVWIVYSGSKVVWIIGHRIDNRFKITNDTETVLCMSVTENNL
ncbi:MAG: tRNA lysidine(34) synthetase TilS [Prolixibacteraceae bacterium]|nr:tRNA lysidine(34) synthetase TilS [Prolixibacteraceae bacterium]